ncbi:hypothetical protein SMD44_p10189 (plasmid) [Streptomyces alboflavus]|uniref:SAF domain-containing protein n=1 Tax=Streptomyces alboflavus TaxID=67267 RepID=A0A291W3U7_9ACTN|nr:SAF domain-containing protein [Streptomyces alboflavus]ATM24688.1 hypothetical protein SMD44_p10189 [Streptomyces alboflavus]
MSTPTSPSAPATAPPTPQPLVRQPVVRRRRPSWIALGVAVVCVAGGAGGWLYTVTSHREPVVAVARDVPMGAELKAEDLIEAQIATDPALKPVPARDLKKMIGKRATTGLSRGSLLTGASVTDEPLVKAGEQLVGVSLSPTRLLATRLSPGQKVKALHTPKESATGKDDKTAGQAVQATVIEVGGASNSGDRVVDLAVSQLDGTRLATWAASGEVSLVIVPVED